jgi:ABC-type uncharacterized transport system ATPase subunit
MDYIIEMLNITKEFPGIKANDNVTLELKKGEIHALLGENGAGKSTLMSVLFGLYRPEEGIIKVRGKEVEIANPNDAYDLGIGMVHQHFKLVHNFTVAENIVLGQENTKYGFLEYREAVKTIKKLSEQYKLKVDVNSLISNISVGMQQRVEILKMLYRDAEILIFDEPTAVLTPQEIEANTSVDKMAEMMVGREVDIKVHKDPAKPKDVVLSINNLSVFNQHIKKHVVKDVSFQVKNGEILCIAGIEGNGQAQLIEAITGLTQSSEGVIVLNGEDVTNLSIRGRNLAGVSHIPEDRHKHGLVLDYTLEENLILQSYFT